MNRKMFSLISNALVHKSVQFDVKRLVALVAAPFDP